MVESLNLRRIVLVLAALALVAAISVSPYVANRVLNPTPGSAHVIATVQLSASVRRGTVLGLAMDRVWLPSNADELQLVVPVPGAMDTDQFVPDLVPLDGQPTAILSVLRIDKTASAAQLTLTVAAGRLADGDYVLRVHRVTSGRRETVATQAFRVSRRS